MKIAKFFLWLILTALACAGCSHKVYVPMENVSRDTLRIVSHDTVKITERLVPVSLPLPEYYKQQVTRDTSSILENGLYRSVASFHDGMLTHTLENLPGAAVEGKVAVHDTIRITTRDKEHKHYREKPKVVYKEKELSWVEKVAMKTGFVAFCLALISIVYFVVRWKLK